MMNVFIRSLSVLALLPAIGSHAQYLKNHNATVSVGAFGEFTKPLTQSPQPVSTSAPFTPAGTYAVTVANQQQSTSSAAGFLFSAQFQPVAWAGVELNYSFTHYSERYAFNYTNTSTPTAVQRTTVSTFAHEATGAYLFHPKKIPFQPFLGIGGGAIDFVPQNVLAQNMWRGAGLAEVGFDVPLPPRMAKHAGVRIEGRSLFYRAPNFNQAAISTRSWRVTAEPAVSFYYHF